ncbi:hypothetical protein ASPACDRAFT_64875 [Aspergillus aculeatus ATCC 16872]|uniref:Major facilitator superfamily (MFS) profile domain-containing protein n=1 Tax=Aspergillus aculeatus (strain ATCC 16872 / CBS 172.66 / WB 5094) TaxID=690307 RepID=A0A1L9WFS4_ASPA1|nr:uncharacterized protein ASPACDRAFT_64875 [Aspergillus aculeatus ATCC 16872]OJJ94955.1 hypothetical protein ASPACDRAFT_64875 [Aspergillus aculeatus ATCC 16872]
MTLAREVKYDEFGLREAICKELESGSRANPEDRLSGGSHADSGGMSSSCTHFIQRQADNPITYHVAPPRNLRSPHPVRASRTPSQLTQDPILRSQYEVEHDREETAGKRTAWTLLYSALIIPWEIHALDTSTLFTTYAMSVSQMGLVYLCVPVGTFLAAIPYFAFIHWEVHAPMRRDETNPEPEHRLVPALGASIIIPAGLFLFAWTGCGAHVHWIVPTVGAMLVVGGNAIIFHTIYVYVALAYPRYAASLYVCNGVIRTTVACGAKLVAQPLYADLGIAGGTSLVAGLCCLCTLGMFGLYRFGAALRARSRFTAKSLQDAAG